MPNIMGHEVPAGWVAMAGCYCDYCQGARPMAATLPDQDREYRAQYQRAAEERGRDIAHNTLLQYFPEGSTVDTVTTYPRRGEGRPSVLVLHGRGEVSRVVLQVLDGLQMHRYRGGIVPRNVTAPFPGRDLIAELSTALYGRPNALKQRAVSRPGWL